MNPSIRVLPIAVLSVMAACGDDPVSYSAPVGINLDAKSSDVANDVVSDEKGINTESGNPYGAFVSDATDALGGAEPSEIQISSVDLLLGGNSTGVTSLGEIFAGQTDVLFVMNDSDHSFAAATATLDAATDGGPVAMSVELHSADIGSDDWPRFLSGSFKVLIRGDAAADFMDKGADADLQVTFTFAAFE